MDYCWLNGEIVRSDQARISPFDRGFLYGDGLFETMRSYGGRVHLLGRHMQRLEEGARILRIPLPARKELIDAIAGVLTVNNINDATIRLTVSRGEGGGPLSAQEATSPTSLIHLRPLLPIGELIQMQTLTTRIESPATGVRLKSLNYLSTVFGSLELADRANLEGLMLTQDGMVGEGLVSNVFWITDGVLYTPSLDTGILPGITRGRVIQLARDVGIEVYEGQFPIDKLRNADECFITNSTRELGAVCGIDGVGIGDGAVGEVTARLQQAYRAEVPGEWV